MFLAPIHLLSYHYIHTSIMIENTSTHVQTHTFSLQFPHAAQSTIYSKALKSSTALNRFDLINCTRIQSQDLSPLAQFVVCKCLSPLAACE